MIHTKIYNHFNDTIKKKYVHNLLDHHYWWSGRKIYAKFVNERATWKLYNVLNIQSEKNQKYTLKI